jgi:pilus assembly protein Flp/PilA
MKNFLNRAKVFLRSEDGPTATEYAVMLALIIIVALAAISGLGTTVDAIFSGVDSELSTQTGMGGSGS